MTKTNINIQTRDEADAMIKTLIGRLDAFQLLRDGAKSMPYNLGYLQSVLASVVLANPKAAEIVQYHINATNNHLARLVEDQKNAA